MVGVTLHQVVRGSVSGMTLIVSLLGWICIGMAKHQDFCLLAVSVRFDVARAKSSRILLVSSAFHMRRAQRLFERQGMKVEPFPVDFQERGGWAGLVRSGETQPSGFPQLKFLMAAPGLACSGRATDLKGLVSQGERSVQKCTPQTFFG